MLDVIRLQQDCWHATFIAALSEVAYICAASDFGHVQND